MTTTAAWLITRASEHPPVLYLMVAIVGVRLFGLARPILRYAERLVSHDAALRLLAERRAAVYDALVPLVPGRLGRRRGDVLASVVDDVDALVDGQLRVRQPAWTAVLVGSAAVLLAGLLSPAAGVVVLATTLVGAAGGLLARHGVRVAAPAFVAARAELAAEVEAFTGSVRSLALWQRVPDALAEVDATGRRLAAAGARSVRAAARGRLLVRLGCGLGVVAVAAAVPPGSVSPPLLALLLLLPLALSDTLLPLPDAGATSVRTRAARERVDELLAAEPAVIDAADRCTPAGAACSAGSPVGGRLVGRDPGAARSRPPPEAIRPHRPGGPVRVREVDGCSAAGPLPRPDRGQGHSGAA